MARPHRSPLFCCRCGNGWRPGNRVSTKTGLCRLCSEVVPYKVKEWMMATAPREVRA